MRYDVIVIGAGPAGIAAARAAAGAGVRVALVDAAPRPGGQFWRHREGRAPKDFGLSNVDYLPNSRVWFVEAGFRVHTDRGVVEGGKLILATGAFDRTIPFPGWQLPGVVTAGAAQAMMKEHGVAIGKRVVVAGSGPFLLPVATGLAAAGVKVVAVLEASTLRGYLTSPPPVSKTIEAFGYLAKLAKYRIPYKRGQQVVAAHGSERLEAVSTQRERLECDALAIGYGFTPQIELAIAAGCAVETVDNSLVVRTSDHQESTAAGVYAAGELTGVGGSYLAIIEGTIAGLAASGQEVPQALLKRKVRLSRFATRLSQLHPVPQIDCPDETVVCRCEGTTAGEIRSAMAVDGRGMKLMTRAGMGWCQGRVCGYSVSCMVAQQESRAINTDDLLAFGTRPIAQPVTLAGLAAPDQPLGL